MQFQLLTAAGVAAACAAAIYKYLSAASATYLVDFYSFRPPSRQALAQAYSEECECCVCKGAMWLYRPTPFDLLQLASATPAIPYPTQCCIMQHSWLPLEH